MMDPEKIEASDVALAPPKGCAFSAWLFSKQHESSQVGQLAHVVARDPYWRGGDRKACLDHVTNLGANPEVRVLMAAAYDRFLEERSAIDRRKRAKDKRREARRARKRNR
jgi:hypothetical protein